MTSIRYTNFPPANDSLIRRNLDKAVIHPGDPFDVLTLEQERKRITDLFRNNGYYYYQNNYAAIWLIQISMHGQADMRLQMEDSVNPRALQRWYIGKVTVNLRRQLMDSLTRQSRFRDLMVNYNGKRMPLRMRTIANDLKMWPGTLYNAEAQEKSQKAT